MPILHAGALLLLGLLPVFAFLLALILLDSYKLVRLRLVAQILAAGGAAAVVSLVANNLLEVGVGVDAAMLTRYIAPVIEELLKGSVIVFLISRHRVGFLVDGAIFGFAVGAGFAAVENIHYFASLRDLSLPLWLVRGFGTAIMHGSVTAIMAILSKQLEEIQGARGWVFLPGMLVATVLHSTFNHFFFSPTVTTVLILVVLPALFVAVFQLSENRTRDWLGTGFDADAELLELIGSGKVSEDRIGAYLQELRERFPPTTVADMLCLLRLRLELSIRAKGILLARQSGFELPTNPETEARFEELHYLEQSIGKTGLIAMSPLFHFSNRDLWQYHMIERA
jgi:RsiW-degrading membrane proteinase PrsW (M82 family)